MLSNEEYVSFDAVGLADLRAAGEVSALELLECALTQADRLNPILNAVVHRADEEARQQARKLDNAKEHSQSFLAGVPFLIKEVNATQGWPHTRSTQLFRSQIAQQDSAIVQRYRQGGLIPFGSTNTPELCLTITTEFSLFGACRNPHDLSLSTGGSSGGAAAAVAAGIVPAADASDGGGSIRVPAACCGLIGLKPSRGLTVIESDVGSAWSGMSVGHVLTRSVRDSAAFLDLLKLDAPELFALPQQAAQSFFFNHTRPLKPLRIALQSRHPGGLDIHPDCLDALRTAAAACTDAGLQVLESDIPVDYAKVGKAMATIINVHAGQLISAGIDHYGITLDQAGLSESSRRMVSRGRDSSAAQYLAAVDVLKHAERQMHAFHQNFDLLLSPVLALPPARLGWLDMNADDIHEYARRYAAYSPFTALFNGTGQPSISLPLYKNAAGVPIGVMFSAAWGNDLLLLRLANTLLPGTVLAAARPSGC
jgi:amidase